MALAVYVAAAASALFVAAVLLCLLLGWRRSRKPRPRHAAQISAKADAIRKSFGGSSLPVLLKFETKKDILSTSPFTLKVETFFRIHNIQYRTEDVDFQKAPKGKLPVVVDGQDVVCDSQVIVEHFLRKNPALDVDGHLSPLQRSAATAARFMVEEFLFFVMVKMVADSSNNVHAFADAVLPDAIPAFLRPLIEAAMAKQLQQMLEGQGIGRDSCDEALAKATPVFDVLSSLLREAPSASGVQFMFGDRPSSLDPSAFAFLTIVTSRFGIRSPLAVHVLKHRPDLVSYVKGMKSKYFPENTSPMLEFSDDEMSEILNHKFVDLW